MHSGSLRLCDILEDVVSQLNSSGGKKLCLQTVVEATQRQYTSLSSSHPYLLTSNKINSENLCPYSSMPKLMFLRSSKTSILRLSSIVSMSTTSLSFNPFRAQRNWNEDFIFNATLDYHNKTGRGLVLGHGHHIPLSFNIHILRRECSWEIGQGKSWWGIVTSCPK